MFALLRPPSESWNTHNMGISVLPSRIGIWGSVISSPTGVRGRAPAENGFWCIWNLKKNTSDGDKFRIFATNIYPYFYDWKPMQSIFDILHKNFQENQLNSRRFPGFPRVVDTLAMRGLHWMLTLHTLTRQPDKQKYVCTVNTIWTQSAALYYTMWSLPTSEHHSDRQHTVSSQSKGECGGTAYAHLLLSVFIVTPLKFKLEKMHSRWSVTLGEN